MTIKSRVRFVRLDGIWDETEAVFKDPGGEFSLSRRRLRTHIADRRLHGYDVTIEEGVLKTLILEATQ